MCSSLQILAPQQNPLLLAVANRRNSATNNTSRASTSSRVTPAFQTPSNSDIYPLEPVSYDVSSSNPAGDDDSHIDVFYSKSNTQTNTPVGSGSDKAPFSMKESSARKGSVFTGANPLQFQSDGYSNDGACENNAFHSTEEASVHHEDFQLRIHSRVKEEVKSRVQLFEKMKHYGYIDEADQHKAVTEAHKRRHLSMKFTHQNPLSQTHANAHAHSLSHDYTGTTESFDTSNDIQVTKHRSV